MADKKLFDVAHPGKAAPSATSRPVIVGHGPIMKDPMVQSQASAPEKAAAKSKSAVLEPMHEKVIAVPSEDSHDNIVAPTAGAASAAAPEAKEKETTTVILSEEKSAEPDQSTEPSTAFPVVSETEASSRKSDEPEAEAAEVPAASKDSATEADTGSPDVGASDGTDNTDAVLNAVAEPAAEKKKRAETEKKELDKQAHIASLIEKKTYFVSVNGAGHRKTSHFVMVIVLMLAIVAAAVVYAYQSGLIEL